MPLTHITRSLNAEDIVRAGQIAAVACPVMRRPSAYFFYGRPAYRLSEAGVIKLEHASPFCFIFDETLISQADSIHAFDTGAFQARLYNNIIGDGMAMEDFSMEGDLARPNKLIGAVFASMSAYFDGDRTQVIAAREGTENWDFQARAYIELVTSPGRNEPDDRICSIEISMSDDVALKGNLKAVVTPHTIWGDSKRAPWLEMLQSEGVIVSTYPFVPGRHPEHYHALLESAVKELYRKWSLPM